jgi:dTDP-4-amino-4,6-dideoxygalactose transaminase
VSLPLFPDLRDDEQDRVVAVIRALCRRATAFPAPVAATQ